MRRPNSVVQVQHLTEQRGGGLELQARAPACLFPVQFLPLRNKPRVLNQERHTVHDRAARYRSISTTCLLMLIFVIMAQFHSLGTMSTCFL